MKTLIVGGVGSGKTTLAKYLSNYFDIPFFSIDSIVYDENNKKRDEKTQNSLANKLNRENYKISYAKYLWLYAEVFERELSDKQYKKIFGNIYRIYKGISEYYSSLAVLKILKRKGNKKDIDNYINHVINTSSDAMLINVMIEKSEKANLSYIKKISINQ